jgi:hypothetical protein
VKVGDLVKLDSSARKNGHYAGKLALIVDFDKYGEPIVVVDAIVGRRMAFHHTQIAEVINESR